MINFTNLPTAKYLGFADAEGINQIYICKKIVILQNGEITFPDYSYQLMIETDNGSLYLLYEYWDNVIIQRMVEYLNGIIIGNSKEQDSVIIDIKEIALLFEKPIQNKVVDDSLQ